MKRLPSSLSLVFSAALGILSPWIFSPATGQTADSIPHLETNGAVTQLVVDGKPFLMLAGELHNSSSSSLDYMK